MELTKDIIQRELLKNLAEILHCPEQTTAAIKARQFLPQYAHRWQSTREAYGTDKIADELAMRVNAVITEACRRIQEKYNLYSDMLNFDNASCLKRWLNELLNENTKDLIPQEGNFLENDMSFNDAMVCKIDEILAGNIALDQMLDGFTILGEEKIIIDENKRNDRQSAHAHNKSSLLLIGAGAAAAVVASAAAITLLAANRR